MGPGEQVNMFDKVGNEIENVDARGTGETDRMGERLEMGPESCNREHPEQFNMPRMFEEMKVLFHKMARTQEAQEVLRAWLKENKECAVAIAEMVEDSPRVKIYMAGGGSWARRGEELGRTRCALIRSSL